MNLFAQAFMLDMGDTFGPFISHFRHRYFTPVGDFGWELQAGAEQLIYERIAPLALRMEAEDYITLPTLKEVYIRLDLPPAARKVYDELEAEMLVALDDGELLSSPNAAAVQGKCRQLTGGAVYLNPVDPITGEPRRDKQWRELHDIKVAAVGDLMDELQGHQLLLAYEYGHERDRLLRQYPDTPYIGGGVSLKKSLAYEADWNAQELPLLLGHPQSMGHGLNLQKGHAHHIAWFTTTWDYENLDQFNRRLRRRGNDSPIVYVYHLVVRNTVDELVMYKTRRKARRQDDFFAAMKKYAHERGYDFRGKLRI
jgi:SNF2 family DNA or RNA helicase